MTHTSLDSISCPACQHPECEILAKPNTIKVNGKEERLQGKYSFFTRCRNGKCQSVVSFEWDTSDVPDLDDAMLIAAGVKIIEKEA